jgi:hypothetical protein
MGNKEYVTLLENYKKALAKAAPTVIPATDKTKLSKLIDDTLLTLKTYGDSEKYVDIHNAFYTEFDKLATKVKKYNDEMKKRNSYLVAAAKYAKSAQTIAGQQKGFNDVKELKKLSDDMEHVSDWLDIAQSKELKVSLSE